MRPQEAPEQSMDPRPESVGSPATSLERSVVDAAVYRDGRRVPGLTGLSEVYSRPQGSIGVDRAAASGRRAGALDGWPVQPASAGRGGCDRGASAAQARPLRRHPAGGVAGGPLRRPHTETVDFGEIHIFTGPQFVLTVRHSDAPDLAQVRQRLEADPKLLALGPDAVLYAVLDAVVDGYAPVVAGLQNDIDEIETQVFDRDPGVSRRIYELSREVIEFQRAPEKRCPPR